MLRQALSASLSNVFHYRLVKFLFSGGLNTLICLILFGCLIKIGLNYLLASSVMFVFGVVEGYLLSAVLVFSHKINLRHLLQYSGVYLSSYCCNIGILAGCVEFLHCDKLVAQLISCLSVALLNYFLVKLFF